MNRAIRLFMLLTLPVVTATDQVLAQNHAEAKPVEYERYTRYGVDEAELSGDVSFLAITDVDDFSEVFKGLPPMGTHPGKVLPENAFDSLMVVAVVHRDDKYWDYHVNKVTAADGTLTVDYDASAKSTADASYTGALILSVPKGPYKSVVFIQNGTEVGTAEVD